MGLGVTGAHGQEAVVGTGVLVVLRGRTPETLDVEHSGVPPGRIDLRRVGVHVRRKTSRPGGRDDREETHLRPSVSGPGSDRHGECVTHSSPFSGGKESESVGGGPLVPHPSPPESPRYG